MNLRFLDFAGIAPVVFLAACATSISEPKTSSASADPARPCDADSNGSPNSLPRYFTLQVSLDHLMERQVMVDGHLIPESDLGARLTREAQNDALRGAALLVAPGVDDKHVQRLFLQLRTAGFGHVLVSGAPLPSTEAQDVPSHALEALPDVPTATTAEPELSPAVEPPPADVIVTNLGLHVGGGPNSAESKERYAAPIARRFDDFRRCHLFAQPRERKASFGVDLLVDIRGGRAKIKDYRTSLKGKDFHLCVLGVFGEIDFPAPERTTVISYSLLFKTP